MLTPSEKTSINRELKGIISEYESSYKRLQAQSEARYKSALAPGEVFTPVKGFYGDEERQYFQGICNKLSERAHKFVDSVANHYADRLTTAPSAEAANMLTVINARKKVSAEELDLLMTRYGRDCPSVYNALLEKAESLEYHDFMPHPITKEAEKVSALMDTIDSTFNNARKAENNLDSAVLAFSYAVNEAFPATE